MRRMVHVVAFVLLLLIGSTTGLLAQWQDVHSNLPLWDVADAIDAVDSLTAIVAIRSGPPHTLYLTTNGGLTWVDRSIPSMYGATDVSMVDTAYIWAATGDGRIYGTTDGGRIWTLQFYDTTVTDFMDYIQMFDRTDGVALGDSRPGGPVAILKTTDGGATWIQGDTPSLINAVSGDTWRLVDFVDTSVGYFFPSPSQDFNMSKTTDGGAIWSATGSDLVYVQVLKFYDRKLGIAANQPQIFRTTDGGDTWQTFSAGSGGWANDIEFVPGECSKIWYTNGEKMFFSSDTGKTWTAQGFGLGNLGGRDIVVPNQGCGWFLCDKGHVYRTSDPGIVTEEMESPCLVPRSFSLSQNYPNPFNPTTTIKYELPEASIVRLSVYDMVGREVTVLVDEKREAGYHEVRFDGSGLASGVYLYRLQAGDFIQTRKLIMVR